MGEAVILVGCLIALVGAVGLIIAAFRENVLWGLALLFCGGTGIVTVAFVITHWAEAKKPFLVVLAGYGVVFLGILAGGDINFIRNKATARLAATSATERPSSALTAEERLNASVEDRLRSSPGSSGVQFVPGVGIVRGATDLSNAPKQSSTVDTGANDKANENVRRVKVREVATSYLALVRSDRIADAYPYLPAELRTRVDAKTHSAWWARALTPAERERAVVAALTVDALGADVSVIAGGKALLLRSSGDPLRPAIFPQALESFGKKPELPMQPVWMPLTPGSSRIYGVQREERVNVSEMGGPKVNQVSRLRITETVRGQNASPPGVELQIRSEPEGNEAPSVQQQVVASRADGLYMLGLTDPDSGLMRLYKPAHKILKLPVRPGDRWKIGTIATGEGITFDAEGEALGYEDVVVPGGTFPGCLKIRMRGKPKGRMNIDGVDVAVTDGIVEQTFWMAAGRGLVRSVHQEAVSLRTADSSGVDAYVLETRVRLPDLAPR